MVTTVVTTARLRVGLSATVSIPQICPRKPCQTETSQTCNTVNEPLYPSSCLLDSLSLWSPKPRSPATLILGLSALVLDVWITRSWSAKTTGSWPSIPGFPWIPWNHLEATNPWLLQPDGPSPFDTLSPAAPPGPSSLWIPLMPCLLHLVAPCTMLLEKIWPIWHVSKHFSTDYFLRHHN